MNLARAHALENGPFLGVKLSGHFLEVKLSGHFLEVKLSGHLIGVFYYLRVNKSSLVLEQPGSLYIY
jgi:hypothetical protein